jgi:hypothetical protein
MRLAELAAGFPWGVLLITDAASQEQIPSWDSDDDQVAVASTALVVRVLHRDEGEVAIYVWDDASAAKGHTAFSGVLRVPSGRLRISDALGDESVEIEIRGAAIVVEIRTNDPREASEVHVVLTPSKA